MIVSEQDEFINDVLYCFQASGVEIKATPARTWEQLFRLGAQPTFQVVIAFYSTNIIAVPDMMDYIRRHNSECLFYVVFEEPDEDLASELVRAGATSFAVKNNLFRLPASIQKKLSDEQSHIVIPDAIRREYFLSSFFEQATEAIWIKDKDGKYLMINPAGARFISRSVEDIIGKSDFDIFPKDTAFKIHKSDKAVIQTGMTQVFEDTITNRDDVKRIFQAVKTVLRDSRGEVQGLIGTVRDVTERKQAEQSAKEAEHRFNLLIQHVKDAAIYILDPEGSA
jgi:PAS domain S-box-containing protein